jgi:hypothetical protein
MPRAAPVIAILAITLSPVFLHRHRFGAFVVAVNYLSCQFGQACINDE